MESILYRSGYENKWNHISGKTFTYAEGFKNLQLQKHNWIKLSE